MRNTTALSIIVIALLIALGTGCSTAPEKASIDPHGAIIHGVDP